MSKLVKFLTKTKLCDLMAKQYDWGYRNRISDQLALQAVLFQPDEHRFPVVSLSHCERHDPPEENHHTAIVVFGKDPLTLEAKVGIVDIPDSYFATIPEVDMGIDIEFDRIPFPGGESILVRAFKREEEKFESYNFSDN